MLKTIDTFRGVSIYDRKFWDLQNTMAAICARMEKTGMIGGARMVEAPSKETVIMRLTNNLGGGQYEFTEMEPATSGAWTTKAGGATYGANGVRYRSGRCHEANLNARVRVPSVQIGTVKYSSAGVPFYRFENCCLSTPYSGSGSDDPTTLDDGVAEREFLAGWKCILFYGCRFPVLVWHMLRFTVGQEIIVVTNVRIEILWSCGYHPCNATGVGPPSGSGPPSWDVWRLCNLSDELDYPQPGDRVFPQSYFESAPNHMVDPVFQEDGAGPCYKFTGIVVTGTDEEVGAELPDGVFRDGCDDENCENCVCEETCFRVTYADTGDWVEVSVVDGQTICEHGATSQTDADNLEIDGIYWVDNAWKIYGLSGDGGDWLGDYTGNSDGCPSGTFTLLNSITGSPPTTVTVGECAPPGECPDPVPARLRLAGYDRTYFEDVRLYTDSCNAPNSTSTDPEWDGTLPTYSASCQWQGSGTYEDADGVLWWQISAQINLIAGVRWQLILQFTRNSNLSGTPSSFAQVRYDKTGGDSPAGEYTRTTGAPYVTTVGCYVIRDTVTVEAY